jgi:transposase
MARTSISKIQAFVESAGKSGVDVGVDVHKRTYSVAIRRVDGHSLTWTGAAEPEALIQKLTELGTPIKSVAYESGPTGFGLARAAQRAGLRCIVAAPSKIMRPVSAGSKTDRLDCLKLAGLAAKGMLKSIAIPTEDEEAERSLIRRRFQIVDGIRAIKQRIKSHLLFFGIPEPPGLVNWSNAAVERLSLAPLQPAAKLALDSQIRELRSLQAELAHVAADLKALMEGKHKIVLERLQSVPGVGITVATTFLLEVFRPERFHSKREVAAYLGLAPTVRHSGERSPKGRLVPVGQKRLRSLLVEAAWIWKAKVPKIGELYGKLLARTGIPQKAISAVARRLAVRLWRLSLAA